MSQNSQRPRLTPYISARAFCDAYWLKVELQEFCREQGLSTAGGKQEIAARIESYLRTGRRVAVSRSAPEPEAARRFNQASASAFTMQTRAPAGFKCTQEMRQFFERHLGSSFRFTVTLQNFIKANPGVSFQEIADEWHRQDALRKEGWKPEISSQFEFNQFTRDFHADPVNRGKSRRECLEAWKEARARPGEHKYIRREH